MSDATTPTPGAPFCCSWSGGKDSCLALHRAVRAGAHPARLLTMMTEDGERSRSHGLTRAVLERQARHLGIPLHTASASWEDYRTAFVGLLHEAGRHGIRDAVFGDIDLQDHREWEESVCAEAGVTAHLPLWQEDRLTLLREWWSEGFEARLVVVRREVLDAAELGGVLDASAAMRFADSGIDPCGENGEFHTVVTDGPLFDAPVPLAAGRTVERGGCLVLDLRAEARNAPTGTG